MTRWQAWQSGMRGWAFAVALVLAPGFFPADARAWSLFPEKLDPAFARACENVGVKLLRKPSTKVTSIGLDWRGLEGPMALYELGPDYRLLSSEGSLPYRALVVDSRMADVMVTRSASPPEEEKKPLAYRGLIRYTLTVTDRRDGAMLATMTFAADMKNRRACGANVPNAINLTVFLRQATGTGAPDGGTDASLPVVTLEVLETEVHTPDKVMSGEAWSKLSWDKARHDRCAELAPPVSSGSQLRRFAADPSGTKRMSERLPFFLCGPDGIWTGSYVGRERGMMELEKYSAAGDLLYKVQFRNPDEFRHYYGSIAGPTLKSVNGYTEFEWWNNNQSGNDRHISRRMKVRFREPALPAQ